jgi:serine/threonine protein kinase
MKIVMAHPHPNVARYYGCIVQNDRLTCLYFDKYRESLMQRPNSGLRNKRLFDASERPRSNTKSILGNIHSGLRHLRSLGLVHNDINPSNIMFSAEGSDKPGTIDFGSCRPTECSMTDVGRTYQWYDEQAATSVPSNVFDALAEVVEWLSDKPNKNSKFASFRSCL